MRFHWDDDEIDLRGAWDETRDEPEEDEEEDTEPRPRTPEQERLLHGTRLR